MNTSTQTNTTSNHSILTDARLVPAVSGSAQSVFVGSNQIKASEEKLYLARRQYTDREQGGRNKQGERNKTLILAACALGHVENTDERCRKCREIYFWEPGLKTVGAHTHTFYHSWQIHSTTHQKGAIKVCCVQSSKRLWPSHQLAATHCARRAIVQLARSSKN